MKLYKYQVEAFERLMTVLSQARYVQPNGRRSNVGILFSNHAKINTKDGRTVVTSRGMDLLEFTPEAHDSQVGSTNIAEKISGYKFTVYMSDELVKALEAFWSEVLKPAYRLQTDVFSHIEMTHNRLRVRQFDGQVFEWLSE